MRRLFLLTTILVVLTACTTTAPLTGGGDISWLQHRQQVSQLQYWTLTGRLAVSNSNESWHLDMSWQQQGENFLITLAGPLGAGQVRLRGSPAGVVLEDGDNPPRYAEDADSLLYDNTGLNIPVMGMRFWVRGLPDPYMSNGQLELLAGKLKQLQQGGWQLQFRRYQTVNDTALPQKLFMQRSDLDVRLVIDQWQLGLPNS